ncbi:low affinity immunoglobulin gamma Fc region receptor II-c-like [Sander lucioperca]|uniref:low affinity immunoglobulin gamma Fc region receptor II-c-like n=1 Tax=Sander lucioperca TaxID=283035 RepID=UPI00125E50AB|nr:low affinity immunoglobulin gamma Fc region receptor II-c-like [Sander lucioperca]
MAVTALCIRLLLNGLLLLTAQAQSSYHIQKADFPRIDPYRLQFFEYESISFYCEGFHGRTDWRVMKKIPSNATRWDTSKGFLHIKVAFESHSGEYWCENGEGERSNSVNITVTAGDVILESPAAPVMEQQTVTLRCRKKVTSDNLAADFYKDGHFTETGYTSQITIHNVSKSNEGRYKCKISGFRRASPESWLAVTAYPTPVATTPQGGQDSSPHPLYPGSIQHSILLPVISSFLCVAVLLLVVGLLCCRKHRVACFSSEMPTTGSDPGH